MGNILEPSNRICCTSMLRNDINDLSTDEPTELARNHFKYTLNTPRLSQSTTRSADTNYCGILHYNDQLLPSDSDQNPHEIEGIDMNQIESRHTAPNLSNNSSNNSNDYWQNKRLSKRRSSKSKTPKRAKLKSRRSNSSNNNYQTIDELKEELNEIEIKLKQQLHEKYVLKHENTALRQENHVLKTNMAAGIGSHYVTNTKTIRSAHQIPPTPPIVPYRLRAKKKSKSMSTSPEVLPLSPVTISITTTNVEYQQMPPNMDLNLPEVSPMVDPLPPVYRNKVKYSVSTTMQGVSVGNMLDDGNSPSTETPDQNSPILSHLMATGGEQEEDVSMLFNVERMNHGQCGEIEDCDSCKRIIKALEWYHLYNDHKGSFLRMINKYQYGVYLLHDYQHILNYHLSNNKVHNMDSNDIEAQYDKLTTLIKHECDESKCNGFKRYQLRQNSVQIVNTGDANDVILNTMDAIHCYFLHLDC